MTDTFRKFINEIDKCTLWNPLNTKYSEISHIKIPYILKDFKVSFINQLMAELPVNTSIQSIMVMVMGNPWFYVFLTLAVTMSLGYVSRKVKLSKN